VQHRPLGQALREYAGEGNKTALLALLTAGAEKTGAATLDAHSLRIRPELSFKLNENTRLYFNAVLGATAWEGTPDGEQEYPGYDVFSAAGVGIRYYFR
jgi:hypothetical protein